MRQIAQLLLMCDRQDIGVSIGSGEQSDEVDPRSAPISLPDEPRIFIYDNYPGGIGFSQPLFAMHADLLRRTRDVIAGCECEHGCPTCVGPVGNTGPLAKLVALRILDRLAQVSLQDGASARVAPPLAAPVSAAVIDPPPAHGLAEPPPF
jgi:DEAD/DEAH box helicase domain-containing protein